MFYETFINHRVSMLFGFVDTDYLSKYKLDYPQVYIPPGQHEAYQQNMVANTHTAFLIERDNPAVQYQNLARMFCVNPPAVNKALTTVCDWAAPPQVQFTLGDDYMHVVRQDPSGRFLGNAVIKTYQLCSHNLSHVEITEVDDVPLVSKV